MTAPRGPELESALRKALAELAPEARPPLLDRTLAAVADTPQRPAPAPRVTAWRAAWTWAAASVVVTAGIAAGIIIGNSTPAPAGDASGSSRASASGAATATPGSSGAPSPSTAPTQPVASGTWERIDLPDPAPDTFTGTRASDVVAFNGEYVAVGMFSAYCGSDIHETPPGCEAVLNTLPTTLSAAVWVSEDARSWTQLAQRDAFEGAGMDHAATDGERIVVTGVRYDPGARPRVAWVSDDGRDWQLIGPEELVPEHVVATKEGFIGARPSDDGPQFVASEDGRSWRALTDPGELGPGHVDGLTVGRDGVTVMAVGATYAYSDDGELAITATNWLSRDHVTWERAPANAGNDGAEMIAATESDAGWVAVGIGYSADSDMAVWTSGDGLNWTRGDDVAAPYGGPDDIAWTGEQIVATGTVGGESSSVIAFWLSADGMSWETVVRDRARDAGTPLRIVAFDGWVIAAGVRSFDRSYLDRITLILRLNGQRGVAARRSGPKVRRGTNFVRPRAMHALS